MLDWLIHIDTLVFKWIHLSLANGFFDQVLPFIREKINWIPLYVVIIALVIRKLRWNGVWFIVALCLAVLVADQFSAQLVKPLFERLRPCNEPSLAPIIRSIVHCGSGYSFISSHATNHFALAFLFNWFFNEKVYKVGNLFYWWSGAIAFAQVYVGVHYPSDVIVGGIFGILIGKGVLYLYKSAILKR